MTGSNGKEDIVKVQNLLKLACWKFLAGLFLFLITNVAQADVKLPNGDYFESVDDLKVKVLGGYVTVSRSWYANQWHPNSNWENLQFTFDDIDGSVKSIQRGEAVYDLASPGVYTLDTIGAVLNTIRATTTGYRWQDRKGNVVDYDNSGKIQSYSDRNNVKVSFNYDASGKLTGVLDTLGVQVLFYEYSGTQISAVRDYANRKVQYQYTGANLTKAIDVLGNAWTYTYDAAGKLLTKTDPEGRKITITYTANNRVASIKDLDNIGPSYVYDYYKDRAQYYVKETSPAGTVTEHLYDAKGLALGDVVNGSSVFSLTLDGRNRNITDARGLVTKNEYDEWNNLTKTTYPDGASVAYQYDPIYSNILKGTNERGISNVREYDSKGNLIRATEAVGRPEQRITEYTYDSYGNRTSVRRLGDAVTAEALTTYTYDDKGNLLTETDPEGNKTLYTYDGLGNVVSLQDARGKTTLFGYNQRRQLEAVTDPLGNVTRYEYSKTGKLIKTTNAKNKTLTLTYDNQNRLLRTTDTYSNSSTYGYNPDGDATKVVDRSGKVSTLKYDLDGRPSKVTDGNGNATQYTYGDEVSGLNRLLVKVIYPTFSADFKYDARGRPTQLSQALMANRSYQTLLTYDDVNGRSSVTDQEGKIAKFEYDGLGRLTKFTDAANKLMEYGYDSRDNVISLKDANGNVTRFEYDRRNLRTKEIHPQGQATVYRYDAVGNLLERVDAKGQKRVFTYDDSGRQVGEKQYTSTGSLAKTISYYHDVLGNLTGYDDGGTSATYSYDDLSRKIAETFNYGAVSLSYSYSYYANGTKKSYTGPDGITVGYSYDDANQLSGIQLPNGQITYSNYQWLAPTKVSLPGGTTEQYSFDSWMRISSFVVKDTNQNSVLDYQFAYDGMNNVLSKNTEHGTYQYSYNNLYQLTQAVSPVTGTESFTYDATGNRLTDAKVAGNWSYDRNDALTSYGNVTQDYDANGNLTRKTANGQITDYVYDTADRLVQVKDGSGNLIAEYAYDPYGRRISKSVASGITYYLYADEGLVGEYDGAGVQKVAYGWKPDGLWGTDPVFIRTSTGYYFYHNDQLGTPQKLTAVDGSVVWSATYSAFGLAAVDPSSTVTNNLRFPGQYFDQETGLHYNYFRYYDPVTGRYLQPDPIGFSGGVNFYAYVSGNPIARFDATGRFVQAAYFFCAANPVACLAVGIASYLIWKYYLGPAIVQTATAVGESCVNIYNNVIHPSDPGDNSTGSRGRRADPIPPLPPTTTPGDPMQPSNNTGNPAGPPTLPPLPPTPATPPNVNTGIPPYTTPPMPGFGGPMLITTNPEKFPANQLPTNGDGERNYVPPRRNGDPPLVAAPGGRGYLDIDGNSWEWARDQHGGPHWDVQHPDGTHTNVSPEGTIIGPDNFPNRRR